MTERLLQYIWQFQYFNRNELETHSGETIRVLIPGHHNSNQGPDFLDAKIVIDNTTWAGSVELHIKTSGWNEHNHASDKNYKNVILHVVWENDLLTTDDNIPVMELKERVPKILLQRYEELMNTSSFIPCQNSILEIREITWKGWKDRLMAERLLRKSAMVRQFLQNNKDHWEETFWWMLARNFGMKINADAFEQVARSIPVALLAKHKNQVNQLEALLLGQAGLLNESYADDYPIMLQKEYRFLQHKYQLPKVHTSPLFLRMRPGNFPTIRFAQLAMLVHQSAHLFSKIKEAINVNQVKEWMDVTANDYWHYHYRFDEPATYKIKKLGTVMIENIVINTIAPMLFAYGSYHNQQPYKDKAVIWLQEIAAEKNTITNRFKQLGIENKNACDSQALIELKNEYCNKKRCLECSVGATILRN